VTKHTCVCRVFCRYDVSKTGSLSFEEVKALMGDVCGDVTDADALQVSSLMDLDGESSLWVCILCATSHFVACLTD